MAENRIKRKNRRGTVYFTNEKGAIVSKVCTKCKLDVPVEGFRRKSGGLAEKAAVCKNCESNIGRKYRESNPDKVREIHENYYKKNREIIREKQRRYHRENPEIAMERGRRWRKDNLDKLREYARKRREENREKTAAIVHRRMARKRKLPDTLTQQELEKIITHFGGCAITGSDEYHLDHVIPLSTGHGGTIFGNIVPLRPDLNISKSDRNMFEWFEANRQRFDLSPSKFNHLIEWLASANAVSIEDYVEHVYWCHENPQSIEDLLEDEGGGYNALK